MLLHIEKKYYLAFSPSSHKILCLVVTCFELFKRKLSLKIRNFDNGHCLADICSSENNKNTSRQLNYLFLSALPKPESFDNCFCHNLCPIFKSWT